MPDAYPPFHGPRLPVAQAVRAGGGPVAGRLHGVPESPRLVDSSGGVPLAALEGERAGDGDWVSGRLVGGGRAWRLAGTVVHARRRGASPDPELAGRLETLGRRASIVAAARRFFSERDFLEVETPARVRCPGLEPHLRAFPAGDDRWLITSPELHLKRLVAAGAERVVEFARAFRDEECGPWHRSEFLLLEWYRAFAGLEALEADCEGLVAACAAAVGVHAVAGCDLAAPFARTTVRAELERRSGLDLARLGKREDLAQAVRERGHAVAADDGWDELFFRVWLAEVEPELGRERPVFVHDWPASQAALARTRREAWGQVAERFELYVAGVEIANAFDELNDPDEQLRRHEADRRARREAGAPVHPLDEEFLAALRAGMPPAAGIALGLDRLAALLLGASGLDELQPF